MSTFSFRKEAVEKAEKDFQKIETADDMRKILYALAKLMANFIPLKEMSLVGFIWLSMREWQQDNSKTILEATTTVETRIQVAGELFSRLQAKLEPLLKNTDDQQHLAEAIEAGFKYYKENFANRAFKQ
ncbi:MAG: hypothetical protein ACFFD4_06790 [Candidatus Odinarchaeota archaeon]